MLALVTPTLCVDEERGAKCNACRGGSCEKIQCFCSTPHVELFNFDPPDRGGGT